MNLPLVARLAGVLSLIAASCSFAANRQDDSVDVLCVFKVKAEAKQSYISLMLDNVEGARSESGNLRFDFFENREKPDTLYLYESWKDQAALDRHLELPYLKSVLAAKDTALVEPATCMFLNDTFPKDVGTPLKVRNPAVSSDVAVFFNVKPESTTEFVNAWHRIPEFRQRQGAVVFSLYAVAGQPNAFVLMERWQTKAEHEAHFMTAENELLVDTIGPYLSHPLFDGRALLKEIER